MFGHQSRCILILPLCLLQMVVKAQKNITQGEGLVSEVFLPPFPALLSHAPPFPATPVQTRELQFFSPRRALETRRSFPQSLKSQCSNVAHLCPCLLSWMLAVKKFTDLPCPTINHENRPHPALPLQEGSCFLSVWKWKECCTEGPARI